MSLLMSCFNPPYCPKIKFFHEQSNDIFLYHPNIRKYSSCRNIQYIFQVIKKLCSIFQSCFCIDFTFAVKTVCVCHYLLPVTLCFVQLLYKCIFKSCKRRNKAVAYQQNQFIYFLLIIYMNRGVALF